MRAEVERFCPADLAGYERFMRLSDTTCRIGFERFGHVPFGSWTDMAKVIPDLLRLRLYRSVHATVARYISDPRLRAAFSFHPLLIGGNPFTTNAIYSLIPASGAALGRALRAGRHRAAGAGAGVADRGPGRRAALRRRCRRNHCGAGPGGQARATGVRLASGEHVAADLVVSNADAAWTYRHLLPARARRRWTDRRLARARHSMSLFVWYFGTRRRYDDVAHHTILLGPRYRGLLDDIFRRKVLADDPSLYLHRPTATDRSLAPDGHDAFYVLSPVPNLAGDTDWQTQAEPYRQRIAQRLSETLLPDLDRQIVTSHVDDAIAFPR